MRTEELVKPFMIVSGLITSTTFIAVILPDIAISMFFAEEIDGNLEYLLVRNWGFLVTIIGILLIYGAYNPQFRNLILSITIASKSFFIILLVALGFTKQSLVTIIFDSIVISVSIYFLIFRNYINKEID